MSNDSVVTASKVSSEPSPGRLAIVFEEVHERAVRDLDAFRLSGRAGRVDHVRELLGVGLQHERRVWFLVDRAPSHGRDRRPARRWRASR